MKLRPGFSILLLCFVTLGVYYPALFAPVNSVDDRDTLLGIFNAGDLSFKDLFLPGHSGYYYRPLLGVTYFLDRFLWELDGSFMHLENILLHTANGVLVYLIACRCARILRYESPLLPLAAALLFALHPINTEAVAWISGRTDLLAGLFLLTAFLLTLTSLESGRRGPAILGAIAFFVGCFAKETAVFFLPAVALVIMLLPADGTADPSAFRSRLWRRAPLLLAFGVATGGYFLFRHLALSQHDSGISHALQGVAGGDHQLLYQLKVILKVSGFYFKKLFVPWPLNFAIVQVADAYILPGVLVVVLTGYLLWHRSLASLLFLAGMAVGSSALLVALSKMAWTPLAERYLYIPVAFCCVALALALQPVLSQPRLRVLGLAAVPLLLAVFALSTTARALVWQDTLTLYQDTVRKSPDFIPVRNELAIALMAKGRKEEGSTLIRQNLAQASISNQELAGLNRALLLISEGDPEGARKILLANLNPESSAYEKILRKLVAIDEKRAAAATDPAEELVIRREIAGLLQKLYEKTNDPFQLYRLGQNALARNERQEARQLFVRAYATAPVSAYYRQPAGKLAETLGSP